jgi:hypothetical protein
MNIPETLLRDLRAFVSSEHSRRVMQYKTEFVLHAKEIKQSLDLLEQIDACLLENNKPEAGYIMAPWVAKEVSKPSKEYTEFMNEYKKLHECCPKCGSTKHASTFMGYVLNMDRKDEYKDLNHCTCTKCLDAHTVHERVPMTYSCLECDKPAEWMRYTQFAGNHPYCASCAEKESDFNKDADSYSGWGKI